MVLDANAVLAARDRIGRMRAGTDSCKEADRDRRPFDSSP